jgi:hypothetical protein
MAAVGAAEACRAGAIGPILASPGKPHSGALVTAGVRRALPSKIAASQLPSKVGQNTSKTQRRFFQLCSPLWR